jgi:FKBP-type peptidyl-prolyl cis-trans isomerase SlyD
MTIARNRVVSIDYTLSGADGGIIDSSKGQEPLAYIHGSGMLVEGLEAALEGKSPADHVAVTVAPEQGYGMRDGAVVFSVPRAQFHGIEDLAVGVQVEVMGDKEPQVVTVVAIDENEVTVDGNHPLAGLTLHFDVDIVSVREAAPEELEHGHAHEGHSHHAH